MRVRAVDADGFASPYGSVQPVDVRGRPPAPRLAEPEDGAVVPGDAAQLRWHAQPGPARYRVQLAHRRPLHRGCCSIGATWRALPSESVRHCEPGVYLWRVAATTESDGEGAFSEARTLRVPPTAPELVGRRGAERSARVPLA